MPTIKRKLNEGIKLASDIIVTVQEISRGNVRLKVESPDDVAIELVKIDGVSRPLRRIADAVLIKDAGQDEV